MDLIDEEDTRNELSNALVDVLVDDLVDLLTEFFCDFGALGLEEGVDEGLGVLSARVGLGVGGVEIVESDILDNFLLFVQPFRTNRQEGKRPSLVTRLTPNSLSVPC